ncbi:MAG: cellulase family glycosylhydrolase [Armatimonadetes bacterium]|nr:cellulase family glycosylhydrolase [Armatimonadota bacterium]MDW8122500.1 cellulase family glycosylhydrolase [Armatimonadota bacterium]
MKNAFCFGFLICFLTISVTSDAVSEINLNFLTRKGTDLFLNGKRFRQIGVNKFDLFLRFLEGGESRDQALAALDQARHYRLRVLRFSAAGFYPRQMSLWPNQPIYWSLMDDLVAQSKKRNLYLVPVINWNLYLFTDMAGECVQDLLTNPDSRSRQYLWLYTYQLVSRYAKEPAILFWELTNEMNLNADLEFMNPFGFSLLNPVHEGTSFMRLRRDHFTTDQMIPFLSEWAKFVRSLDPNHLISSGFSAPRPAAQHLRKAQGKGDWTPDTYEDMETYLRDTHPDPIDIISIHFYQEHDTVRFHIKDPSSPEALDYFVKAAQKIGKPIFIGETGEDYQKNPSAPFIRQVLDKCQDLSVPLILLWNWMSPGDPFNVDPQQNPELVRFLSTVQDSWDSAP